VRKHSTARRGAIIVYVALLLMILLGFAAFALDLGQIADAKVQCQNAADAAAIAGARTLDGRAGGNQANATAAALATATGNRILATVIAAAEVSVRHGAYHYNAGAQTFAAQFPPTPPDNYNLTEVTITHPVPTILAGLFGIYSSTVHATSTAAHDPRDIAIVLDYSGSMNNESDLWNCESYLGSASNSPNNTDPVFPQFGPYQPAFSPNAQLQCASGDPRVGKSNVTMGVLGISAIVNDLYQNAAGSGGALAFQPAPGSITNTLPGGDQYLPKKNTAVPAVNWQEIQGSSSPVPSTLYNANAGVPYGYTQGPGYWGKTFFIWPPDPRGASDWRKKFFFLANGSTPLNDNTRIWDANGNWQDPPAAT